jgi:hypothetical protein
MNLKIIGWKCADWISLALDRDQYQIIMNMVMEISWLVEELSASRERLCSTFRFWINSLDVFWTENRTLELHSPDGVHSCVLRASDPNEATAWFNTLHSALNVLTLQALQEANRALGAVLGELQHIGWLARKSATTEVSAVASTAILIASNTIRAWTLTLNTIYNI